MHDTGCTKMQADIRLMNAVSCMRSCDRDKEQTMWRCMICGYVYDDAKEDTRFEDLPEDWSCPVCNAPKDAFVRM
jgi:rubredoxin